MRPFPASIAGAATIALVAVSSGCSDPKAANEANFRKALAPVVADAFCTSIHAQRMSLSAADDDTSFPIVIPAVPLASPRPDDAEARSILERAAGEGLLTRKTMTAPARRVTDIRETLKPQALVSYDPTAAGKPYFHTISNRRTTGVPPFPGICSAVGKVVDIVRWTDPADIFGQTIARVTYTRRGIDVAAFVAPGAPGARATLEKTVEDTVALVRTSDGWQPTPG